MVRKSPVAMIALLLLMVAVGWVIYEHYQAVKWLESFQPPVATSFIQFSNVNQQLDNKNCYPGTCYRLRGTATNVDTKPHSFKFVVEYYSTDRFVSKSDVVTIDNLGPTQSVAFTTNIGSIFGSLENASATSRIFSIDFNTFDSSDHCTRIIIWYIGQSQSCSSGGL